MFGVILDVAVIADSLPKCLCHIVFYLIQTEIICPTFPDCIAIDR